MDNIPNEVALASKGNVAAQQRLATVISSVYKNKTSAQKESDEEASLRQEAESEIIKHMMGNDKNVASHMLTIIYFAHFAKLYGYLKKRFTNMQKEDAEEKANDTLMAFFKNVRRNKYEYQAGSTLKAYLYGITFKQGNKWLRKNKPAEEFDESKHGNMSIENHSSLLLLYYLKKLPKNQQQVIELTLDSYTQDEIADQMNISRRTVNNLKQKAIAFVRTLLTDPFAGEIDIIDAKAHEIDPGLHKINRRSSK